MTYKELQRALIILNANLHAACSGHVEHSKESQRTWRKYLKATIKARARCTEIIYPNG